LQDRDHSELPRCAENDTKSARELILLLVVRRVERVESVAKARFANDIQCRTGQPRQDVYFRADSRYVAFWFFFDRRWGIVAMADIGPSGF
jgi:hypothetical protein